VGTYTLCQSPTLSDEVPRPGGCLMPCPPGDRWGELDIVATRRGAKRFTGIGEIFLRARHPGKLAIWYRDHLGLSVTDQVAVFKWVSPGPDKRLGNTVWAIMAERDRDRGPGPPTAQVNYRVPNLDGPLGQLRSEGVVVSPRIGESKYGRFGWAEDPEGNRMELWEPPPRYRSPDRHVERIEFPDPAIHLIPRPFWVTDGANGTMPIYSLQYRFRQPLRAPARAAYSWCIDYEPGDGKLFPEKWVRSVRWLSEDAVVLTDTTYPGGQARRIHRLVRLNPSALEWTNTHLDGPFRHSQYWYRIVPDDPRTCHLEFRALRLEASPRTLSASESARMVDRERRWDSNLWRRRMAPALERDLAPHAGRSSGGRLR
jgi:predicted enzyme related to lactoylglutathione lyase